MPRVPPVSSSPDGCELAFRATVAFEHAPGPPSRPDTRPLKRATPFFISAESFRSPDPCPFLGHSARETRSASHLSRRRKLWASGSFAAFLHYTPSSLSPDTRARARICVRFNEPLCPVGEASFAQRRWIFKRRNFRWGGC